MLRRNIHFVYTLNQSFHWFIMGLFFPIMVLVQLEKGLSLLEVGTTSAIYSATIILLELPTGGMSDSIGRKKVYLISVVAWIVSYSLVLFAWNFFTFAIAFLFLGVARAFSSGSMDAWFVDEFNLQQPGGNLQRALARAGVFFPLALAISSVLGGVIPMTLGPWFSQIQGLSIYSANIVIIIALGVVQLFLTSYLVIEHGAFSGKVGAGLRKLPETVSTSIQYGVRNPFVRLLLLATLAIGFSIASLELLWQPRVVEIIGPDSQTWIYGVLAAGYFLMGSVGNLISASISTALVGRYSLVLVGMRAMMGVFLLVLALQGDIIGFAIFYFITFTFVGLSNSLHAAIFNSQVPSKKRSTLMSFQSLIIQMGFMLGALAMGAISDSISIPTAFAVGGVILLVSSIFYMALYRSEKSGKLRVMEEG
jgi:DHA1 family quinolone resistance protein-like MFS transporter